MRWLRQLLNSLRAGRVQQDVDRELSFHLAERIDDLRSEGFSDDVARRRARLQFGNPVVQRERTLDVDLARVVDALGRNIRYAVRSLLRTPGFSLTVAITLSLGIGANAAVFSAIDAVLLRPLSFPDSDRLVRIRQARGTDAAIAPARLDDWRRQSSSFEALSGYYVEEVSDTAGELPERLRRAAVAPAFMEVWSVTPARGRGLVGADHRAEGVPPVLVSDRYWRRRLNADPNAAGRTIRIDDRPYTVVGVMPQTFQFPVRDVDVWWPYPSGTETARNRTLEWYTGVGRLKPGVTPERARAELAIVQGQLQQQYPETDADIGVRVVPLKDTVVGGIGTSLWMLFAAVSVLLLIACTNIAALLLTRATQREHEIAVRSSLGASRVTIVMQLLSETAVLAAAGAVGGLFVAGAAAGVFQMLAPDMPRVSEIGSGARTWLYTAASAIAVAAFCGLWPAVRSIRRDISPGFTRTQVSRRHSAQWVLVAVQVALSVTLLSGAALLVRSIDALARVEPGFDSARVLAFRVTGNWTEHYRDPAAMVQRIGGTLDDLSAIPGVTSAATSWTLPGAPGPFQTEFAIAGRPDALKPLIAGWRTVSPGYFHTMRIPVVTGAICRSQLAGIHRPGLPMDLMVNRSFADRYFSTASPIGIDLIWENRSLSGRVTGIVANARELGIDQETVPTVYACDSAPNPFPWFLVSTNGDPAALATVVRLRIKNLDPLRSVYDLAPLATRIDNAYAQNRLRTTLLAAFAGTALLLACLGVYGTLSYLVGLRRREIALRLALGAARSGILRQVLSPGVRVVGVASACGLLLSLATSRALTGMLYGVSPSDPVTLAGVILIVLIVAGIAAIVPAARAARVNPMRALRAE
jgi:putative ABC transport system permease protein